jgi:hypothetical protein
MTSTHTTVYIDNGAGDEIIFSRCIDHLRYIFCVANMIDQMQTFVVINIPIMHRYTYNARCDEYNEFLSLFFISRYSSFP